MPKIPVDTRERILRTAAKLFYGKGIRSTGVDAIAEKAGVTKRTLYYHFRSKDDLIAAYLEARDHPNRILFAKWFADAEGTLPDKVRALFTHLEAAARHPRWNGCGFLKTAAELAALPGHPAIKVAARHKAGVEAWLAETLASKGVHDARGLARQIVILMDGAFSSMLVHRDPGYFEAAGRAAASLVGSQQVGMGD
ncbi:Transcriptional regulator, TetR family [Rubellimicrobium mesophilum DSM 19309]|uniref:Transcriptional regulator, TetR family n=1 Tax=Rubellimicrobium mesophilum DSM 19309 TaxID=442562 RepID=A0A017HVF4_9RHOB|nr:TetR/AcrR family transcriptional regulator [Rubellimicrobium mesophilum]EYD78113.1 Transcriptional regulator, TetR family [Rubellimicrobium mesophilum DSM 19309]